MHLINYLLREDNLPKTETLPIMFVAILQLVLDRIHLRGQEEWEQLLGPSDRLCAALSFEQDVLPRFMRIKSD